MENAEEIKGKIKEGVSQLREEAEHFQGTAREKMKHLRGKVDVYRDEASELLDNTNVYIKDNPQKSTIIAGLSGFLMGIFIGLLIRGRN